ncbi:MAG TPA: cyclase family protein [Vicinamibacterales bacterium]|nr:cyclase family protein [Vicinamibacterales bacterium]
MSTLAALVADLATGRVTVVDLTQPLGPDTPVIGLPAIFGASPGVSIDTISRYDDQGPAWYWNTIRMGEHTGTHFDAPVHWITGRDLDNNTTDTIPASQFIGPACVIDVTAEVERDEDYLLDVPGLERWESRHGRVPRGAWVLLRTGWSRRSGDAFQNVRADGPHGPGFDQNTSMLLASDRDVLGVGVETIGTDAGQAATFDPPFPNHAIMHGHGKCGLASLCNLDRLPATGAVVIAAPLKIVNGSGSPVRAIALVPS